MVERAQRQAEQERRDPDTEQEKRRRPEDPAEPEWVLARIQQSFDNQPD